MLLCSLTIEILILADYNVLDIWNSLSNYVLDEPCVL